MLSINLLDLLRAVRALLARRVRAVVLHELGCLFGHVQTVHATTIGAVGTVAALYVVVCQGLCFVLFLNLFSLFFRSHHLFLW